ncbi:MAG: serine protease [Haloplasmataceae bacterium]|jgi:serine protease Do|nr:serine protease [Haloplasmataceae bacterium]
MNENKRSLIVGTVIGGILSTLLIAVLYFGLNVTDLSANKVSKISYQVDVQSIVNQAIDKASPNVVGIVRFNNEKESGTGSGVIYKLTEDKVYVVTNNHVITGGNKVEVAFVDEERVEAEVIGVDLISDLAVITIPRGDISNHIEFADSDNLKVGEFVFAIGNPLGLNFYGSATLGIVSSTERLIPIDVDKDGESDWFANVIQTDAAINPGNSGGALVNVDGKLVGINSMKIAGSQVEGIGFSIPSNIVFQIVNDLEVYKEVKRPYLGIVPISISRLNEEEKAEKGIEVLEKGILVHDVTINSPAYLAGIKANDVITHIEKQEIKNVTDLRLKLYNRQLNDTVTLTILRDNKNYDVKMKLQAKES